MNFFSRVRYFLLAYWIALVYVIREFRGRKFKRSQRLDQKELCSCKGYLAVVTGGSRGIGLEIVKYLLQMKCNVIIGSSSSVEVRSKLENLLKSTHPNLYVSVWHLDLASLQSVQEFSKKILSLNQPLHLLINNAGVMFISPRKVTKDGLEYHFSVNYLSHCLLSLLLLPSLTFEGQSQSSRIVNSTSCIHYVGNINLQDLQGKNYSKYHAYMQSKLAQIMFMYSLQTYLTKKDKNITVTCAHPGVANTDLMNNVWWTQYIASLCFKTAKEAAETIVYAAVAKEMEGVSGKYLEDCAIVEPSKMSRDVKLQNELWSQTLLLLKPWLDVKYYDELNSHQNVID